MTVSLKAFFPSFFCLLQHRVNSKHQPEVLVQVFADPGGDFEDPEEDEERAQEDGQTLQHDLGHFVSAGFGA